MRKDINSKMAMGVLIILSMIIASYSFLGYREIPFPEGSDITKRIIPISQSSSTVSESIKRFSSEKEFESYLQEAEFKSLDSYNLGGLGMIRTFAEKGISMEPTGVGVDIEEGGGEPQRVSDTNVQVLGIDEPDIVKTDGKEIYFSSERYYRSWWGEIMPPPEIEKTKVIKGFPPGNLSLDSEISVNGNMLLSGDVLIIFSGENIYGYNVSDPILPREEWEIELDARSSITGARLYGDKVYLITRTNIDSYHPCPIRPLSIGGSSLEIKCADIYHPVVPVPVDVTYNAVILDPSSGKIEKSVSFVGSSDKSIVYMSDNGIYVTYTYSGEFIRFISNFFDEECQDIVPSWLIDKMNKLSEYDISSVAKFTEFGVIFNNYFNSLDEDEKLRIENEFNDRMTDYYKGHMRELGKTGIVKMDLENLDIVASGNVPGELLNQFSLDEYENHLRIAVTVGDGWFGMGMIGGERQSANDVYILDENLKMTGSVTNLGLTEKIYSARFIQDKGYLVTFRQIDPFYVLDLSNPKNPEMKGELKIPGYSSYLHPITKDKILGIGKQGSQIKISLFDVEFPENPFEADKYILNEYWSDVLNTHHAFLLDKKHEIFFLPGSKGGYIFSYEEDFLKLTRAVSNINAKRAIYIDDYLYIIGEDKIIVLNEIGWEEVGRLSF